jgi:lipopolysaccharide biosynthesis glycosyltransferase
MVYVSVAGLNSGTVLMDLPRMRAANWSELFIENFMTYKDKLIFCDQDLYNIFFYSRPGNT